MSFWNDIESDITFTLVDGSVATSHYPHSTGWRTLPFAVFVYNAGGKYLLERKGEATKVSEAEQSFFVPPGIHHSFTVAEYSNVVSTWVHFEFKMLDALNLFNLLELPLIFDEELSAKIKPSLDHLRECARRELNLNEIVDKKSHEYTFMSHLLSVSKFKDNAHEFFKISEKMMKLIEYIHQNYPNNPNRKELASVVHLSENRLSILFKKTMGLTLKEYIKKIQMERSQFLLIQTDKSVGEIGREIGIEDPFYFSKAFKAYYRINPLAYRKRARNAYASAF